MKIKYDTFSLDDDDAGGATGEGLKAASPYVSMMVGIFVAVVAVEMLVLFVIVRATRAKAPTATAKTLIVLGSGGHTAEMLKLVESLDKQRYTPRAYVVADTDKMSGRKAVDLEKAASSKKSPKDGEEDEAAAKSWELFEIPRSREVGQSYITSVWTTLVAIYHAAVLIFSVAPQVVLVNGPGTCIPVCFAAFVYRMVAAVPCKIVYVESIARTRKLSLSGMILYHSRMADLLLVQWQELADRYPRAKFAGRLY